MTTRRSTRLAALATSLALLGASHATAAVTMAPLTSFGTNGWLAPGSTPYLGTANNERGLAYGNGHVYLVSRTSVSGNANNIRILNPTTGADLGGLNSTGITGGTFTINTIGVAGDGVIYVNNLTTASNTSASKIYSWATEGSTPTVAYSGTAGLSGARVGDSLAVTGSGASTQLALGYGNSPNVAGNNGYAIVSPATATATAVGFVGTPPNAGDFRLGITFAGSNQVLGSQGSGLIRNSTFSGSTGTLTNTINTTVPNPLSTAERLIAYINLGGVPIVAYQSNGDSHVSLYDITNPASPVYLAAGNTTTGTLTANGNGSGQIAWGPVTNLGGGMYSATLYAMGTNQGIQAFTVTIPEPTTLGVLAGMSVLGLRRRK